MFSKSVWPMGLIFPERVFFCFRLLFGGGSACVVYIPAGSACVLGMRHSLMAYMKPRRSLGLTGHASTSSASILSLVRRRLRLRRIYPSRLRLRFRYEAQPDGIYETEAEPRLNGSCFDKLSVHSVPCSAGAPPASYISQQAPPAF